MPHSALADDGDRPARQSIGLFDAILRAFTQPHAPLPPLPARSVPRGAGALRAPVAAHRAAPRAGGQPVGHAGRSGGGDLANDALMHALARRVAYERHLARAALQSAHQARVAREREVQRESSVALRILPPPPPLRVREPEAAAAVASQAPAGVPFALPTIVPRRRSDPLGGHKFLQFAH